MAVALSPRLTTGCRPPPPIAANHRQLFFSGDFDPEITLMRDIQAKDTPPLKSG